MTFWPVTNNIFSIKYICAKRDNENRWRSNIKCDTFYLMILIKNKSQVKTTADANQKQLNRTAFITKKHGSMRKH